MDFTVLLLVAAAALFYRYVQTYKEDTTPNKTEGPEVRPEIPEAKYIPAIEISDFDASSFMYRGSNKTQLGMFPY
jgi:hypothetical protein